MTSTVAVLQNKQTSWISHCNYIFCLTYWYIFKCYLQKRKHGIVWVATPLPAGQGHWFRKLKWKPSLWYKNQRLHKMCQNGRYRSAKLTQIIETTKYANTNQAFTWNSPRSNAHTMKTKMIATGTFIINRVFSTCLYPSCLSTCKAVLIREAYIEPRLPVKPFKTGINKARPL